MLYLSVIDQLWTKLWHFKTTHLENRHFYMLIHISAEKLYFPMKTCTKPWFYLLNAIKVSDYYHFFFFPMFLKNFEKKFLKNFYFFIFSLWSNELPQNFIPPSKRAWKDESNEWSSNFFWPLQHCEKCVRTRNTRMTSTGCKIELP